MRFLVWPCLMCVLSVGYGQVESEIFLNNEIISAAVTQRITSSTLWPTNNCDPQNGCYAILQFTAIPTTAREAELAELGIILHHYIPNNAYLASYSGPLDAVMPDDVVQVLPLEAQHKRPNAPLNLGSGAENTSSYRLVGMPFPGSNTLQLAQALESLGAQIIAIDDELLTYEIPIDDLSQILSCPLLQYTEAAPVAPIPEGKIGRTNSRIVRSATGLPYRGDGVAISIGDDGTINHLDFHGRLVDHTQYDNGSHGEMTAGMAGGGGNIDPATKGSAPGSTIHIFDIGNYDHLELAPQHFENFGTVITSTSYGEGCGEVYEISTAEIDDQVYNNPSLLHVFSAGNHGTDPCYNVYSWLGATPAGNYYATITGGRKAGKNVLAVGNVDWNDELLSSSSRGPTPDGRIKPDLSALGQLDNTTGPANTYRISSGTSAAAPNAAGVAAILEGYYLETHNSVYPSSALIKALMLNSADDLGVAGPDYHYGWGRLNARKALAGLQSESYREETIAHQQQQSFQLAIPTGAQRLKVMLYWHDPAGSVLSAQALVNDLDLKVQLPNGQQRLPWIPSAFPHLDSLGRAALPGIDRLNNVEQVVIDQPAAGYYNLVVDGFQVPEGPQTYYLVYEIEMSPIQLLSPQAGETFVPGEQAVIAWDAISNGQPFTLDVSYNNGQTWSNLATNLSPSTRSYLWAVPNSYSNEVRFRLQRGTTSLVSQEIGVLSTVPVFSVEYQDATTALMSWDPVPGAVGYQVFRLGDRYMDVLANTNATSYALPAIVGEGYWHAVAPVFANGKIGRRANAEYYEHFGCEMTVNLTLHFDLYPGETSWYILDASGGIRATGGPYTQVAPFSTQVESICLPPGCFTLVITDAYSDGMCCANGEGWFRLTDNSGNELASGGEFNAISYDLFCVEESSNPPLQATINVLNPIQCAGGATGIVGVTATGGSGNYNYSWSNGSQQSSIGNLSAGTYSVTVSDETQSIIRAVVMASPAPLQLNYTVEPAICSVGSIQLFISGGTAPYEVDWSDGATGAVRNNLNAGTYYVLVTDAYGCLATVSIDVTGSAPLSVILNDQNPNCYFPNSGNINAIVSGGSGNYNYNWSNGATQTSMIGGLPEGQYSLTVTDGNCTATASAVLINPEAINVNATIGDPLCHDDQNGWIALEVNNGTAPFSYFWSDGATDAIRTGLGAGVYLVTITDAAGCNSVRGFPLENPSLLGLELDVTHVTSNNNGAISLEINGGTGPYVINWDNGQEGPVLNNLSPGAYMALVTDQNGCQSSTLAIINDESTGDPNAEYCYIQGASTNYEWIESLILNGNHYFSGNDDGYGDYVSLVLPMRKGELQNLTLIPGYTSTNYNEYWKVWIDYNQNGSFDDPGETVISLGPHIGSATVAFTPPQSALGPTIMRVAMSYGSHPSSCENINYGEIEDYTIEWIDENEGQAGNVNLQLLPSNGSSAEVARWSLYPNPAKEQTHVRGWSKEEEDIEIIILDAQGRHLKREYHHLYGGNFQTKVSLDNLPSGNYQVQVIGKEWREMLRLFKH